MRAIRAWRSLELGSRAPLRSASRSVVAANLEFAGMIEEEILQPGAGLEEEVEQEHEQQMGGGPQFVEVHALNRRHRSGSSGSTSWRNCVLNHFLG